MRRSQTQWKVAMPDAPLDTEKLRKDLEDERARSNMLERALKDDIALKGKLGSGYSLCHPEDDCEARSAWADVAGRAEIAEARLGALLSACKQWRNATLSRLRLTGQRGEAVPLAPDQALLDAISEAEDG